jgi:hypothetical protein
MLSILNVLEKYAMKYLKFKNTILIVSIMLITACGNNAAQDVMQQPKVEAPASITTTEVAKPNIQPAKNITENVKPAPPSPPDTEKVPGVPTSLHIDDIPVIPLGGYADVSITVKDAFSNFVSDGTLITISAPECCVLLRALNGTTNNTITEPTINGIVNFTANAMRISNSIEIIASYENKIFASVQTTTQIDVSTSKQNITSPEETKAQENPTQFTTKIATKIATNTTKPISEPIKPVVKPEKSNSISTQQLQIYNGAVPYSYNRSDWGSGWSGSCPDVRGQVLIAESSIPVTYRSASKCTVDSGTWQGPFTGTTFTQASDVDIDHMVPLQNAHISGGWQWSSTKKRDYYNYLGYANHLIAVDDSTNQSKSASSPDQWTPPNPNYHCTYATDWINIKTQWNLTVTTSEWNALQSMLNNCGQTFNYSAPTPTPNAQQSSNVSIASCEDSDCNCGDFSNWGEANDAYQRSIVTYGTDKHDLDRNNDGVPCESLPGAP